MRQLLVHSLVVCLYVSTTIAQAEAETAAKPKYRGYLGVELSELSPEDCTGLGLKENCGVKIPAVVQDSPAEKAGLINEDVILSINRRPVGNVRTVVERIQNLGAGATVEVVILRNGREKEVSVTLAPHPQDLLEEPDSSPGFFKVKVFKDIPYFMMSEKDSDEHKLNLVLPVTEKRYPLVMWIHGGGWSFGDRCRETALGVRFAERGVGFAAINHRLSSGAWKDPGLSITGVKHPEHIKDCARAFAWLCSNIESYGADPNCIFVGGYSSGGHLATLLALDPRYLKELNISSSSIKAVIAVGGTYDLVKYHAFLVNEIGKDRADAHLKTVFGPTRELWQDASPTSYLQNCNVPMLAIAEKDKGLRQYMEDFRQAAEKADINFIKFLVAEDRSHKQSPSMMSRKGEDAIRDAIIGFIRDCCKDAGEKLRSKIRPNRNQ